LLPDGWHDTIPGTLNLKKEIRLIDSQADSSRARQNLVNWFDFIDESDSRHVSGPLSAIQGIRHGEQKARA